MPGKAKRFSGSQILKVDFNFESAKSSTLRKHRTQYEVSETAVRKVWAKREVIRKSFALMSE